MGESVVRYTSMSVTVNYLDLVKKYVDIHMQIKEFFRYPPDALSHSDSIYWALLLSFFHKIFKKSCLQSWCRLLN